MEVGGMTKHKRPEEECSKCPNEKFVTTLDTSLPSLEDGVYHRTCKIDRYSESKPENWLLCPIRSDRTHCAECEHVKEIIHRISGLGGVREKTICNKYNEELEVSLSTPGPRNYLRCKMCINKNGTVWNG
jgi:hypothetical protein